MSKNACGDLAEMRTHLLSLERILFKPSHPVAMEKVNSFSQQYDCKYDARIRNKSSTLVCLLNELMYIFGRESAAWELINQIEETLASPKLYRDMIFKGECPSGESYLQEFRKLVTKEIDFLSRELSSSDYDAALHSIGNSELPSTKENFFKALREAGL